MKKRFLIIILLLASTSCIEKPEPSFLKDTDTINDTQPDVYTLREVVSGLDKPLYITHSDDDSDRLYILEQRGVIRVIQRENSLIKTFLDINDRVGSDASEQGLLGMAFHPEYDANSYFFVHYTDTEGDTVISRFKAIDPDNADPASESVILTADQPYSNHNGGQIVFGPDGFLYIGLGDGGLAADPHGNAQSLKTLLGKILRIDINTENRYGIPMDNPFVNQVEVRPEIWAYGLRNPWRFSFDRLTGDMYIGDVGQNNWEEIDFEAKGSKGGANYGWNKMEGSHCFILLCDSQDLTPPIFEYQHGDSACSVTGGYVYRGSMNQLYSAYVYGDYCSGEIWALKRSSDVNWSNMLLIRTDLRISSFGEDGSGELYVVDHKGAVYRLSNS